MSDPKQLTWAAVDFDGTLAESLWSVEDPTSAIGEPIWGNVEQCIALRDMGYSIVIHTARGWADHKAITEWLQFYMVPFDQVVCGKLLAAVYIDDRAVHSDSDWLHQTRKIGPIT